MHCSLFPSSPIPSTFPDAFGSEEEGGCCLHECEEDSMWEGAPLSLKSTKGDGVLLTVPLRLALSAWRHAFLAITEGQNIVMLKFNTGVCYFTWYVYS